MRDVFRRAIPCLAAACVVMSGCVAPPMAPPEPGAAGGGYRTLAVSAPHAVMVFPESDMVIAEGYTPGTMLTIELLRPDGGMVPFDPDRLIVIGRVRAPVGPLGTLEVNHTNAQCWSEWTPDILPGDVVRVTPDGGLADTSRVAHIRCDRPIIQGNQVIVHGNAHDGFGNPLPLDQLEHRLISGGGNFVASGGGRLRTPDHGTLTYDMVPLEPGDWMAVYPNLSGTDLALAADADSLALWLGSVPLAENERTIFENPLAPPGPNGCVLGLENGISETSRPVIGPTDVGQPITLGGLAAPDVVQVAVRLNNGAAVTVALPQTAHAKAWRLTVPAASIGAPVDGPIFAAAVYTTATGEQLFGRELNMPKAADGNQVAATPPGGAYALAQAVTLSAAVPDSQIYYTTDGSDPLLSGVLYTGAIAIARPTTLRFYARDPLGNPTPVYTEAYAIGDVTPPFISFSPGGGTYGISQFVYLQANEPATLHYTTDGSAPTQASTAYTGSPVLVTRNTTLRVIGVDTNGNQSPVVSQIYTIRDFTPPVVTARPYKAPPEVTWLNVGEVVRLETNEMGTIYYTTDGSEPTRFSSVYPAGGIPLTRATENRNNPWRVVATTLRFRAVDLAGNYSAPTTGLYRARESRSGSGGKK